jgi:hypothetical protein
MVSLDLVGLGESQASNDAVGGIVVSINMFDGGVVEMDGHLVGKDIREWDGIVFNFGEEVDCEVSTEVCGWYSRSKEYGKEGCWVLHLVGYCNERG